MSNPYAIAAVTHVLTNLLEEEVSPEVSPQIGNVEINAQAPDQILTNGGNEQPQLNVFLYRVTPNTGWQNSLLPSRDSRGDRITNQPLALNLHYLLSAYGVDALHNEMLLGWGMHVLHENPVMSREDIRVRLTGQEVLRNSRLDDQVEHIRIAPENLNTEELSKLWTAVQSPYRPTAAYVATVVLIEADEPTRTPLPVLTRGPRVQVDPGPPPTFRETGVFVQPSLIPPVPTIESLVFPQDNSDLPGPQNNPAIEVGQTLTIKGHHLNDDEVVVEFSNMQMGQPILVAVPASATASEIEIELDAAEDWGSGLYQVRVVLRHPDPDNPAVTVEGFSNKVAMLLVPAWSEPTITRDGSQVTIELTVAPRIRDGQPVSLIVGMQERPAEEFEGDETSVSFIYPDLAASPLNQPYPARLRVDGVESLLIDRSATPPSFLTTRELEVPA